MEVGGIHSKKRRTARTEELAMGEQPSFPYVDFGVSFDHVNFGCLNFFV